MTHFSYVNAALAEGESPEQYAKDSHEHYLRTIGLEPAGEFTLEGGPGWYKVTCPERRLRSDRQKAADSGKHQCVLEYNNVFRELPVVQCFERDGKLWLDAYDDEWQVQFCPVCGFSL